MPHSHWQTGTDLIHERRQTHEIISKCNEAQTSTFYTTLNQNKNQ